MSPKLKELVVDFQRDGEALLPLIINGLQLERVDSLTFLGTTISSSLKWDDKSICIIKKAHQRLIFTASAQKVWSVQRGDAAVIPHLFNRCGMVTLPLSRGSSWTELFALPQKSAAANPHSAQRSKNTAGLWDVSGKPPIKNSPLKKKTHQNHQN